MWCFTEDGFYSVVAYDPKKDRQPEKRRYKGPFPAVLVRARVRKDLDRLRRYVPRLRVYRDDSADYMFRSVMTREEWTACLAGVVARIDYSNFKSRVSQKDHERSSVYSRVWGVLLSLQPSRKSPRYGGYSGGGYSGGYSSYSGGWSSKDAEKVREAGGSSERTWVRHEGPHDSCTVKVSHTHWERKESRMFPDPESARDPEMEELRDYLTDRTVRVEEDAECVVLGCAIVGKHEEHRDSDGNVIEGHDGWFVGDEWKEYFSEEPEQGGVSTS